MDRGVMVEILSLWDEIRLAFEVFPVAVPITVLTSWDVIPRARFNMLELCNNTKQRTREVTGGAGTLWDD